MHTSFKTEKLKRDMFRYARKIVRAWDIITALLCATLIGALAPSDVWGKAAAELVTFFGIQAAAVIPAMIFAAGLLRPDAITLGEARRYQEALRAQMVFWITLLVLDFVTAAAIIIGKSIDWTISLPSIYIFPALDLSRWLSGFIAFVSALAILRTIPFLRGIFSLLELQGRLTENVIMKRNIDAARGVTETEQGFKAPEGYGKISTRH